MLLYRIVLAILSIVATCLAADQDILTILGQQTGISTFTGLLQQFDDLVDILNQGTFSVLAPSDQALATFTKENPDFSTDTNATRALLEYHVVNGTHPSATFGLQPLFPATLLNNPVYANVTGGQVVEIATFNNQSAIISGVKAVSHLVEADIFYLGGLIHIIDTVLTIPLSAPATITKAGLTDLVALLSKGGFLDPSSSAVTIVNSLPDLTFFGPNASAFSAAYTGWDGLSTQDLSSIFEYSISQGPVVYSSRFANNTKIPTLDKIASSMTEVDGEFFIDSSQITARDYITANGVLQILDSPLNPNTTGAAPSLDPTPAPSSGSGGLSTAAAAGLGIALGALVLGGALGIALYLRNRRRRRFVELRPGTSGEPPPRYELDTKGLSRGTINASEVPGEQVFEIHVPPKPGTPPELDGRERSQINVTIQGTPPRHLGFQARY